MEIQNGFRENTIGEVYNLCAVRGSLQVPLITIKDAAKVFDVSNETIRRWIDEGKLIATKVDNLWLIQLLSFSEMEITLDDIPF